MAEKMKLTQAAVKAIAIPTDAVQVEVWDAEQTGFGVRVGRSGRKVFFVLSRVNGRTVRATVGKFPEMNVDDARKRARRMLVDMGDGINPNEEKKQSRSSALALEVVFKSFMAARKELSPSTVEGYHGVFERYLSCWKTRNVGSITPQMVLDLHRQIGDTRGKNVANQAMRLLRVVLNYSRSVNQMPKHNPVSVMSEVKAWYKDGRRSVVVRNEDMPKWFKAVLALGNDTGRDYLLLVLFCGLRRNEGMALRWKDVDLANGLLTIPEGGYDGDFVTPIPIYLLCMLAERKAKYGDSEYVFPSWSKSGHLTSVEHVVKEVRKCGVPFTLHDLRRTFITTAESLDISTYVVKRLANHKQDDVTGKHYVVHNLDRLREPMERISREILRLAKV